LLLDLAVTRMPWSVTYLFPEHLLHLSESLAFQKLGVGIASEHKVQLRGLSSAFTISAPLPFDFSPEKAERTLTSLDILDHVQNYLTSTRVQNRVCETK